MTARCGRCGTSFVVDAPGRYPCPSCGVTNEVRAAPGAPPPAGSQPGPGGPPQAAPLLQPPPPPPPDVPSVRQKCPECEFEFIVGAIPVAVCPMCDTEVETGSPAPEAQE